MSVVVSREGVTLVPGVCAWHLAEVVVHGSSGRGSQKTQDGVLDGTVRSR